MPRVVVVTPPEPILDMDSVMAHLHLSGGSDDAMIEALLKATIEQFDGPQGWLGLSLGEQELEWRGDGFPRCEDGIRLPCGPLREIVSVGYDDASGTALTVPPSDYALHGAAVFVGRGMSWPTTSCRPECVRIRYRAGFDAGKVPEALLAAIKLGVGQLYALAGNAGRGLKKEVVEGVGSEEWDTSGAAYLTANRAIAALVSPFRVWG